ncbi:MAG: glycosyltransferase family 1 protein [Deltaproteobacteria bacterium]|nr:glycosyltransferase family 1 protein [Deltaproteobacteria bacterium]
MTTHLPTLRLSQTIVVHHWGLWGKWPETADLDFSEILSKRWTEVYDVQGIRVVFTNRYVPAYYPYVHAGITDVSALPVPPGWIDNRKTPDPRVVDSFLQILADPLTDVITWQGPFQCYPEVLRRVRELGCLNIIATGDDCPGSSEAKTFPVAPYADAACVAMLVWDYTSGAMTEAMYKAQGCPRVYPFGSGHVVGLPEAYDKSGNAVEDKIARVLVGDYDWDLCFVGYAGGGNPVRSTVISDLNGMPKEQGDLRIALHGVGMRDGELPERGSSPGGPVSRLYQRCLCGVNLQQSGLLNTRFVDLPACGVVQILHDRHQELKPLGFVPGEHYLPFDGTTANLLAIVREARRMPGPDLARLLRSAARKAREFLAEYTLPQAVARACANYKDRFPHERFQNE